MPKEITSIEMIELGRVNVAIHEALNSMEEKIVKRILTAYLGKEISLNDMSFTHRKFYCRGWEYSIFYRGLMLGSMRYDYPSPVKPGEYFHNTYFTFLPTQEFIDNAVYTTI